MGERSTVFQLRQTLAADILFTKEAEILLAVAKGTMIAAAVDHDGVFFQRNLQIIPFLDVEGLANISRNDDPSQIIYFSDATGAFHRSNPPSFF